MKVKKVLIAATLSLGLITLGGVLNTDNIHASRLPNAYCHDWVENYGDHFNINIHHYSASVRTPDSNDVGHLYKFKYVGHGYYDSRSYRDTIQPEPFKLINRNTLRAGDSGFTYMYLHRYYAPAKYIKSHFSRTNSDHLMDKCNYTYHESKESNGNGHGDGIWLERIFNNYYPNNRKAYIPRPASIESYEDLIWTNNKTHVNYQYIGHGKWKLITNHHLAYLQKLVKRFRLKNLVNHDKNVVNGDKNAVSNYQEEKYEDADGDDDGDAEAEEPESDRIEEEHEEQDAENGKNNLNHDENKLSHDQEELSETYDF